MHNRRRKHTEQRKISPKRAVEDSAATEAWIENAGVRESTATRTPAQKLENYAMMLPYRAIVSRQGLRVNPKFVKCEQQSPLHVGEHEAAAFKTPGRCH